MLLVRAIMLQTLLIWNGVAVLAVSKKKSFAISIATHPDVFSVTYIKGRKFSRFFADTS